MDVSGLTYSEIKETKIGKKIDKRHVQLTIQVIDFKRTPSIKYRYTFSRQVEDLTKKDSLNS